MPWGRVDDDLHDHPKTIAAGNEAMGVWVRVQSWCNKYLSDGFCPWEKVVAIAGGEEAAERVTARLCRRARDGAPGFWYDLRGLGFEDAHGIQMHDFYVCNRRAAEVRAEREQDKQKKRIKRATAKRDDTGRYASPQESPRESLPVSPRDNQGDSSGDSPPNDGGESLSGWCPPGTELGSPSVCPTAPDPDPVPEEAPETHTARVGVGPGVVLVADGVAVPPVTVVPVEDPADDGDPAALDPERGVAVELRYEVMLASWYGAGFSGCPGARDFVEVRDRLRTLGLQRGVAPSELMLPLFKAFARFRATCSIQPPPSPRGLLNNFEWAVEEMDGKRKPPERPGGPRTASKAVDPATRAGKKGKTGWG